MTASIPFPADRPVHPLDYWLSLELAHISPPEAPSRLRQLADAQGTLAAGWSGAISGGPVLVLGGGFASATSGNISWFLVLGLLGTALAALGVFSWQRVRANLPNTDRLLISRGPGSARGGIALVAVLTAACGGILATYWPGAAARGDGTPAVLIGAFLLLVALLVACILVPAVVLGRARQSFRRRVLAHPGLRQAVEEDLAGWRDPYGNAAYGPL